MPDDDDDDVDVDDDDADDDDDVDDEDDAIGRKQSHTTRTNSVVAKRRQE